jgi:hypothetical protein
LEEAPDAYEKFRKKTDGCIKVVIIPGMIRDSPHPSADRPAADLDHPVAVDFTVTSRPASVSGEQNDSSVEQWQHDLSAEKGPAHRKRADLHDKKAVGESTTNSPVLRWENFSGGSV